MTDTKSLKLRRRGKKGRFTRYSNTLSTIIEASRPETEVKEALEHFQSAFEEVQTAHEEFAEQIVDDAEFEIEERWMNEIHSEFSRLKIECKQYLHRVEPQETSTPPPSSSTSAPPPSSSASAPSSSGTSSFKLEKLKLPKFKGDVREYNIFKTDFVHLSSIYTDRDAVTLLRSCLEGKPAEMLRGVSDYKAAWKFLDAIYGSHRFLADAVLNDINTFRALREGEDGRFCELTQLVLRSHNTMKDVGHEADMDNPQVLATIEKKLHIEDKKVWFRHLNTKDSEASVSMLIDWMTGEMTARIRATAPIRAAKTSQQIHHIKTEERDTTRPDTTRQDTTFRTKLPPKCWICQTDTHWVDQCQKLITMTQPERLKLMKENKACFSCLKKAGKDHRMSNCRRKRQCSEGQCRYFHHPLLHLDERSSSVTVASNIAVASNYAEREAMLPVLEAEIMGQKGSSKVKGNVLIDSGSQVSVIKQSVADKLNLQGTKTAITIKKIGGQEETVETHVYKVPVKAVDGNSPTYMIRAVALPFISDVDEVDVKEIAEVLKIDHQSIHRRGGDIDLLIGIDHPTLHTGRTRQAEKLVARKSPIGWVVFGPNQSSSATSRVLHVQLASPVDLPVSDFCNIERKDRCLTPPTAEQKPTLCVFSEASESVYGTCAYLRWQLTNGQFQTKFVTAKSRGAPLKRLTIPRLELQASVMATRLSAPIKRELKLDLERTIYFVDSMIALSWIRSQARNFKPFVSARIGEIQTNSDPQQWKHVPDPLNPADDISRGITIDKHEGRLKSGPEFICLPEEQWPEERVQPDPVEIDEEKRSIKRVLHITEAEVIDCSRFSSWRRLVRVTAYILRFVRQLKSRVRKKQDEATATDTSLTPNELDDAETQWIQHAQKSLRERLKSVDLKSPSPFIEKEVVRVGGRVDKGSMSYEDKHPILLPRNQLICFLITCHFHDKGHDGVASIVAKVRRRYWIIRGIG
ncbi:uncharacterized protein LOC115918187 [Strongylocentrotus purpuratus]|uniref:Peptidase aspartic putative domain-containing protein n=1 Tax=Strongylocentrotus purpuratus TaxID=7668 RepID=A0A7M7P1Z1_STRPU|nr:uncharacterized protein LOC115918187 [Strongylocentrotus purpuratus]